jgi:hypothetical protein
MKKIEEASLATLEKSIKSLNKEWKFYLSTGLCPKCNAQILGYTEMYDEQYGIVKMIKCTACAKSVHARGGAHLEEILARRKVGKPYGPQERKSASCLLR